MNKLNKLLLTYGFVTVLLFLQMLGHAQDIKRPAVWGIAKMTFLVSDYGLAKSYYGDFLGFDHAFSYPSENGKVMSFKVNDRQFLEFIEDKNAREKMRLVSVSFEVDDLQQMKAYLNGKGVETSGKIVEDGAGNQVFTFYDPSGIPVEYIKFSPNSLHKKSKGKFLAEERISKRIHHVGLYTESVKENDQFYKEILGFKEMWRFDDNDEAKLNFIYLQMPDCVENIEYCVMDNPHVNHPCLLVDDMQETIYTLKERRGDYKLAKPIVGKGNRWLLNIKNPDGTKVEFTEAHTIR